jgi:hypothetical protein
MILGGKRPIFQEKAQSHNSNGNDGHRGSMRDVFLALHHSDIACSKGKRLFRGISKEFKQGEQPQGEFKQGDHPQEENEPFPLMSKGET